MQECSWLVALLMVVVVTNADVYDDVISSISFEKESALTSSDLLFETQPDAQHHYVNLWKTHRQHNIRQLSFQWSDCSGKSDPAHINSVSLSPDPLKIPGPVTFGFQFQLNTKVSAPVSLDLDIKKKIAFVWVSVKSFHFPDFCTNIGNVTCPTKFPNCHCPYNNGVYTLPPSLVKVTQGGVPGGQYQVTGWFKQNNVEIACVWAQLRVS